MTIKLHHATNDEVIRSAVALGSANYAFALSDLVPLIGRFDEQRKKQNAKFYQRLKEDIVSGLRYASNNIGLRIKRTRDFCLDGRP